MAVPSEDALRLLREISCYPHKKVSVDYPKSLDKSRALLFDELCSAGFLARDDEYLVDHMGMRYTRYRSWCISPDGWRALHLFQQQLDQLRDESKRKTRDQTRENSRRLAEKAAEKRLSWRQFWLGLFLGWLLGGFTPQEFWNWLKELLPFL